MRHVWGDFDAHWHHRRALHLHSVSSTRRRRTRLLLRQLRAHLLHACFDCRTHGNDALYDRERARPQPLHVEQIFSNAAHEP
jgi:hypothetical protein